MQRRESRTISTLSGKEETIKRTTKKNNKVKLDVNARELWMNGQNTLSNAKVFDPTARRYLYQTLKQYCNLNKMRKVSL